MRAFFGFLVAAIVFSSVCFLRSTPLFGPDPAALNGLWTRWPDAGTREDAAVAFYYFHHDGIGLFRFGRIGYNTTNSYRWSADDNVITIDYKKTGQSVRLAYRIEAGTPNVLVVDDDSQNPGVKVSRYTFVPFEQSVATAPDLFDVAQALNVDESPLYDRIDNRLWIDHKQYATGGSAFSLYQLRAAGIDGRGTGWHHVGDFDDWSTEALGYRVHRRGSERELDLLFTLRNERSTTPLTTGQRANDGAPTRVLTLLQDPRGFWAPHAFDDAGPSFATFLVNRGAAGSRSR